MRTITTTILVLLGMFLMATAAVSAEDNTTPSATTDTPSISGTLSTSVLTSYLAKPGILCHRGMVAQGELKLRLWDTGLYLDVWGCYPFQEKRPATTTEAKKPDPPTAADETTQDLINVINASSALVTALHPRKATPAAVPFQGEIDYAIGYATKLGDNWSLDTSLLWYDFNVVGNSNDDQWTAQSILTFEGWGRTRPSLQINWYGKTGSLSPPNSLFAYLGLDQSVKLFEKGDGTSQDLNIGTSVAFSDGKLLGTEAGPAYTRLGLGTEIILCKNLTISPSVLWQHRLMEGAFARKDEIIGGLAFSWAF